MSKGIWMSATTVQSTEQQNKIGSDSGSNSSLTKSAPPQRDPVLVDYLLFFLGIPVLMAVVFSLVGTKLTNGMPYLDSLIYMSIHMLTAWLPVCLGAYIIKFSFRSWQPPVIAVCLIGLMIALIPTAILFQKLGDFFATLYPVYASNRQDAITPSLSLDYILHFIRYSAPILPAFLTGVYCYRFVTGVDWFGYQTTVTAVTNSPAPASQKTLRQAKVGLIEGSKLADNAELLAIKAEQHYIQIWSDQGTDLVRFRFSDIDKVLGECNGIQVHRSWWVNLDRVNTWRQAGRKLELTINDELSVPVSLSYKNAVLSRLKRPTS
jgi:hypothetical protein